MKRQLPATDRGHRQRGAAETPQRPQVHHSKSYKSIVVGMTENRTKATLDPCIVSGILNSECTELPALEDSAPFLAVMGNSQASRSLFSATAHPAQPQEGRDRAQPLQ